MRDSMSLRAQLTDAMKEAMKAKDAKRLATVRLILAALKDRDIAARSETNKDLVSDDDILTLLAKMIKQREESATAFDAGNRPEMAQNERDEITVIRSFMPAQMDEAAMKDAVAKVIAESGAASIKDMGKVMAVLKERYAGQMDFSKASATTKDALSGK
ncbi:MAG: GatB/YqeY domain-containing protein [Alphaproteobacteria bacterium]